jgi:hypothetical protein
MLSYVNEYKQIKDDNEVRIQSFRETNNEVVRWKNLSRNYRYEEISAGIAVQGLVPQIIAAIRSDDLNRMNKNQKDNLRKVTSSMAHIDTFNDFGFTEVNRILRETIKAINTHNKGVQDGGADYPIESSPYDKYKNLKYQTVNGGSGSNLNSLFQVKVSNDDYV